MNEKQNRLGNIAAIACVVICAFILITAVYGPTALIVALIAVNFISGPWCLIAYLLEVKKGIFANDDDE